jgi:Kef-type K+ transport system membrane component KefB
VTTNQILIGIGLILVLAVGAQILASRLHIPAIIVLLPAGKPYSSSSKALFTSKRSSPGHCQAKA